MVDGEPRKPKITLPREDGLQQIRRFPDQDGELRSGVLHAVVLDPTRQKGRRHQWRHGNLHGFLVALSPSQHVFPARLYRVKYSFGMRQIPPSRRTDADLSAFAIKQSNAQLLLEF